MQRTFTPGVGTLGTEVWRIVGEETQSAQVKFSLYFGTGCCVTEAGLEFLTLRPLYLPSAKIIGVY